MFRGVNAINLDGKGRISIPTRYRGVLTEQCDGKLVVTVTNNADERCLWLYPIDEWMEIERKLVQLPSLNATALRLRRLLIGHASDCEMDRNGRVLLAQPLREFAGLDKRVVLIGQGNKFEIWDEDQWNRCREQWFQEAQVEGEMTVELESLSL